MRSTRTHALVLAAASLVACRSGGPTPTQDASAPVADPEPAHSAQPAARVGTDPGGAGKGTPLTPRPGHELAAFAAGCFWGVEDAFRKVPGVVATAVGYTGGHTDDPTYEQVCTHTTGHAETVLVEFDPARVPYDKLVRVFYRIHEPTTPNRQGPDVGDQYRSAIFTFSPAQVAAARAVIAEVQPHLSARIVTEVTPMGRFFVAEGYHQQYAERTGDHSCPIGRLEGI